MAAVSTFNHAMLEERFDADGFAVIPQVLSVQECDDIAALASSLADDTAGTRCLLPQAWCGALARRLREHPSVAAIVPATHVAVQCTYFEKSVGRNWLVPIHQDLSIPVAARVDHPDLRGWSDKEGSLFVQPPADLLAQLVALRVHLDPCGEEDGPLQFVPGSHRGGRLTPDEAQARRQAGPLVGCAMERGGVLAMRPLALHASSKASGGSRRRVLHFVFGPPALPHGLHWHYTV